MAKHLVDTDLYVDLIRSGRGSDLLRNLYEREAPGIYFSSVVAQELLAGAHSDTGKRNVRTLLGPFERAGRIVTPSHAHWKEAGEILCRLLMRRPEMRRKLSSLVNDCLIAISARRLGATLYTRNREDFLLLREMRPFSLVVVDGVATISPKPV